MLKILNLNDQIEYLISNSKKFNFRDKFNGYAKIGYFIGQTSIVIVFTLIICFLFKV
jgi:hypothetical protein